MSVSSAVYHTALTMDGPERKRFLEQFFRKDAAGLARMNRLLEKSGESSAFFLDLDRHRGSLAHELLGEEPVGPSPGDSPVSPAAAEGPGSWIGPYRLISRIGEGGCGVVYEAEQDRPVRRRVAVKIIRLGMDTESIIARFGRERQALALMQHPNIAQVFDAGATSTGRPYFVMERVRGEKITACCDRERLDVESRIRLFVLVCHAIQHAHQKGVIHRDIKPSNVLVAISDEGPVPKVIDFGIAKAADSRSGRGWTLTDQIMGTPAYMSPEQVDMSGTDVDTRSDVYSLGALLYELLCGRPPFDEKALSRAGISEMRRTLIEQEPPAPSRVLLDVPPDERASIASLRREEPARLVSHLRGDLDWIVARAMAKDRSRRYQTVNALAADLERFLSNLPIVARPPSSLYLLRKYVRRNRILCLAGAVVTATLVGGLGTSTWLYLDKRAALLEQERLARAAELANLKEARLHDQVQARANVSRAAVLLSEGNIREADALFLQTPLESIEPSREAAAVFRSLGNWYAAYGRWKEVARCYTLLDQANRLDDPVTVLEGSDILAIAPALIESGNEKAYENFRREILGRYLPVQNSLQAEHLLKAALLTPADPALMDRLRETALVCSGVLPRESGYAHFPEWEAFALALYYSRLGKTDETLEWAGRSLEYADATGARTAAIRSLTGLARFRSGDREGAEKALREARQLMPRNWKTPFVTPENPPDENGNSGNGTWHSWAVARILLREAEQAMDAK